MTVATMQGLTPDLYGYRQCSRCGTWRAPGTTNEVLRMSRDHATGVVTRETNGPDECTDVAWCSAEVARKRAGGSASAIPAPSEGLDRSRYMAHAGSPTGLDENGDAK